MYGTSVWTPVVQGLHWTWILGTLVCYVIGSSCLGGKRTHIGTALMVPGLCQVLSVLLGLMAVAAGWSGHFCPLTGLEHYCQGQICSSGELAWWLCQMGLVALAGSTALIVLFARRRRR